jgi:hypothetical protein
MYEKYRGKTAFKPLNNTCFFNIFRASKGDKKLGSKTGIFNPKKGSYKLAKNPCFGG